MVYQIRDLTCSYQEDKVVLRVPELDIYRHELVFVVGTSGGGKSTLIETLGLMNRTTRYAKKVGAVRFFPADQPTEGLDLLALWDGTDTTISNFRKRCFSFIFQQTNLMPNFSGGENMLMTALLAGKTHQEASREVLELVNRIGLPERAMTARTKSFSGGQQQRMSFIRALVADYEVLFGDEPTGNLDEATAGDCLRCLKDTGRTSIIVSHDLNLAVKFADRIVPISLENNAHGGSFGNIDPANILVRDGDVYRKFVSGGIVKDPKTHIRNVSFKSPRLA